MNNYYFIMAQDNYEVFPPNYNYTQQPIMLMTDVMANRFRER